MTASPARPFLGVLMLDTRFPRPPGDVGNEETYRRAQIPVRFLKVEGASPRRIVQEADPRLLDPFVQAARALVAQGAALITTSCGFLAAYQSVLAAAVPVPVVTSSILQCQGFARPGIVTFDAAALTAAILAEAHVPVGTPVQGLAVDCEMHRRILHDEERMDLAEAGRDVVRAATALVEAHPAVQDIVLECTNMPPYRTAVATATGRRVHDIETLILARWRQLG
ncbi:aspartate/glutamate racemase family protein [Pseudorhodoferax sp.]|uniref:aspartate/glutamate racemase family protein n=1 Tax=Pseudorhodoferax sp. TaxID=1993553 RepID=UPI0039E71861